MGDIYIHLIRSGRTDSLSPWDNIYPCRSSPRHLPIPPPPRTLLSQHSLLRISNQRPYQHLQSSGVYLGLATSVHREVFVVSPVLVSLLPMSENYHPAYLWNIFMPCMYSHPLFYFNLSQKSRSDARVASTMVLVAPTFVQRRNVARREEVREITTKAAQDQDHEMENKMQTFFWD